MSTRVNLVWTAGFVVVSLFLSVMTWRLLGGPALPAGTGYTAVFSDVSALAKGNDVRVAGVTVGRVTGVELDGANHAVVSFTVPEDLPLTDRTRAAVKYKNLTGDRYLSLSRGIAPAPRSADQSPSSTQPISASTPGSSTTRGTTLAAGAEIPMTRTTPALDLDALFGGFQPLFDALTPQQVNRLSGDLVQVLQGQGGNVMALLRDIADFTVTLADRDAVIGQVITDLNTVLGTMTEHSADFGAALDQGQALVTGLAKQRKQISAGLDATTELADELSTTLEQARPQLVGVSTQAQRLSELLTAPATAAKINQTLTALPKAYQRMAGAGAYGAWTNFNLCGLGGEFSTLGGEPGVIPMITLPDGRCRFQ